MRKRGVGINVGGSSILVIFVLLCLTTFATLSLVSANADYKLSQQTARATTNYYEADAAAEVLLSQVDAALRRSGQGAADENAFYAGAETELNGLLGVTVIRMNPNLAVVSYQVDLDDTQALQVQLHAVYPALPDGTFHTVQEWKVVSTAALELEEEESSIKLWDGGPLLP